jgi:hypothetical protein
VAGGLAYDAMTKKWIGTALNTNQKFVLRLQYRGRRETKGYGDETIDDYEVTITDSGKSEGYRCHGKNSLVGVFSSDGRMKPCQAMLVDYKFNLKNGRFLSTYAIGYVNGRDTNNETCTKID